MTAWTEAAPKEQSEKFLGCYRKLGEMLARGAEIDPARFGAAVERVAQAVEVVDRGLPEDEGRVRGTRCCRASRYFGRRSSSAC